LLIGDPGPAVILTLVDQWMIGELGCLQGEYSIVAQVEQVLSEGDEWPALRLTRDAPTTSMEIDALKEMVEVFASGLKEHDMGMNVGVDEATVAGPALLLRPIAIFR
jgi:hypothetical protein